ncbi:glycosyltransferase family 4 protein [Nesterenkonia salmonea]|uniref:Glycosyltransferase family 4 protein n=1 Tax=Nesterenkonia salmonea TaxID=1804987 RepID=A0A5R9BCS3_9MICC|nr:glycosyltransferase family 4 protein [Nesterenkonia salmonea]TLP97048.1 glycosyltransferase family 4 protein [Nesterenkonia salmonea]
MTRVVQIVPELRTGSGVEAVAYHLEQEWAKLGVDTSHFTLADAGGGWLPEAGTGLGGKLTLATRVVWFSTVGTIRARRMMTRQPEGTVIICHNDALAGDVYVNHGITAEAMKARGNRFARMVRNPLHLFVWVRDALRFAAGTHQVVVNLSGSEEEALRRSYPSIRSRTVIIGNGVDTDRYRPDPDSRAATRASLGIDPGADVGVFVGHEYSRKGLPQILEAMTGLPDFVLLVVGGSTDMMEHAKAEAASLGVADRVRFLGQQPDPRPYFHASDVFVFPSAYESYGLVILEALACGVPVVATAVGCVPDVLTEGVNGAIVAPGGESVREGIRRCLAGDRQAQAQAARETAEDHSWTALAREYLELFDSLRGGSR